MAEKRGLEQGEFEEKKIKFLERFWIFESFARRPPGGSSELIYGRRRELHTSCDNNNPGLYGLRFSFVDLFYNPVQFLSSN